MANAAAPKSQARHHYRPLFFLLLLFFAGDVLFQFQFQAQPRLFYHCNAFTISQQHAVRSVSMMQKNHDVGAVSGAVSAAAGGDNRLFSVDRVGRRLSSPSLPCNDNDEDNYSLRNQHHQPQKQSTNKRRDFFIQSISTASSIMVSSTIISMSPLLVDVAFANDDTLTSSSSPTSIIIDPAIQMPTITQKVYLDIKFEKYVEPKRLIIGLFGNDLPKTVENFVKLCTNHGNVAAAAAGGGGGENENGASYVGSTFYRALSGNSIQGGAIGSPNNDGSIGTSAFEDGKPFLPDNYNIRHTLPGLVSAVRANSDGYIDSRFFVQTESDAGWADGRYAAFGIVLDDEKGSTESGGGGGGMDLVRRISRVDVTRPRNSPKESVTIVGCGLL